MWEIKIILCPIDFQEFSLNAFRILRGRLNPLNIPEMWKSATQSGFVDFVLPRKRSRQDIHTTFRYCETRFRWGSLERSAIPYPGVPTNAEIFEALARVVRHAGDRLFRSSRSSFSGGLPDGFHSDAQR